MPGHTDFFKRYRLLKTLTKNFSRLIQHEIIFSFNTPTFRHSAFSGCSKQ